MHPGFVRYCFSSPARSVRSPLPPDQKSAPAHRWSDCQPAQYPPDGMHSVHLLGYFAGKFLGKVSLIGQPRIAIAIIVCPHREDIAGWRTPQCGQIERIINDRHKAVGGTDNAGAIAQIVHRRIVAVSLPTSKSGSYQTLFAHCAGDGFQHFGEIYSRKLARGCIGSNESGVLARGHLPSMQSGYMVTLIIP